MERFTVTMYSNDIDLFERKRADLGMTKSAFIRMLLYEYDNSTPAFIKHKEIIRILSEINVKLNSIILDETVSTNDKIVLNEYLVSLKNEVDKIINN